MEHLSSEYERQLNDLASLLCPMGIVAVAETFEGMRQTEAPRNKYDETKGGRWDDQGNYFVVDL